ncbi:DUF2178 domain-containing protein [Bacillus sp. FJAT-42376]|nr:DUF2178 domain-containing protein [Bacillus sp. FJAT-42376]
MIQMKPDNLTNALFSPLKAWAEQSNGHSNMLIIAGLVLVFAGAVLIFIYQNKIGKGDERTNQIYLKSAFIMLGGIVLCDLIFPKDYLWQIFFLFKYSIAFIAAGVYLAVRYKRDFLN